MNEGDLSSLQFGNPVIDGMHHVCNYWFSNLRYKNERFHHKMYGIVSRIVDTLKPKQIGSILADDIFSTVVTISHQCQWNNSDEFVSNPLANVCNIWILTKLNVDAPVSKLWNNWIGEEKKYIPFQSRHMSVITYKYIFVH